MFYVYVLHSTKTGRSYTGSCEHLEKRLEEHNSGPSHATKSGRPWVLHYHESFATRAKAVQRERFFKTGRRRDELRANGLV
jgi:putative endonuclease